MPDKELASRLKAARQSVGLSLTEAAKRLGFKQYQILSNIENADRAVKVSELAKFAQIYFRNISEFLDEINKDRAYSFLWRNGPKADEKKEIEGKIFQKCEQYHLLEKLLNICVDRSFLDVAPEHIRNYYYISDLAEQTRLLLKLGSRPAFALLKVLEQDYGVKILFLPLGERSAASLVHTQCGKLIIINSTEVPWRRNYDLAHELFHLILWKIYPPETLQDKEPFDDMERKANFFASALLLPEDEFKNVMVKILESQKNITYSDLVDMAMDFGVSTQAVVYRCAFLKYIKWDDAKKIAQDEQLAEKNREKRFVEQEPVAMSDRFATLAVKCLRKGLISRGKFADIVEIDRSDIDNFIENKGIMEKEGKQIEIMAS
jgi:Zn-dependent peptidase ImmA (M78 family)